jgi:hypothetical protein
MASGSLTYLMGCGVASTDRCEVCSLMQRVVPSEARGDAELALWDGSEFGLGMVQSSVFLM